MQSKEVTKPEFDEFIRSYPSDLEINIANYYDPPLKTYNDFSDGKSWPDSVVALVVLNESYPTEEQGGKFPYICRDNVYKIVVQ